MEDPHHVDTDLCGNILFLLPHWLIPTMESLLSFTPPEPLLRPTRLKPKPGASNVRIVRVMQSSSL